MEWTLTNILDPWADRHPDEAQAVREALDLIAADPFALVLRPYMGHDAPGEVYVYSLPDDHVDIAFCMIEGRPGVLGLWQVIDWHDGFGPEAG